MKHNILSGSLQPTFSFTWAFSCNRKTSSQTLTDHHFRYESHEPFSLPRSKNRFSLVTPNIPLPTSSESLVFYQIHTPWFNDYFLPLITQVVQELNYPRTYPRTQSNDPTVKLRQHINQLLFLFIWTWLIPWSLS